MKTDPTYQTASMAAAIYHGMIRAAVTHYVQFGYTNTAIYILQELIKTQQKHPYSSNHSNMIAEDRKRLDEILEKYTDECTDCDGTGENELSDCCGADIKMGLCSDCKEHMERTECESCKGAGYVMKEVVQ